FPAASLSPLVPMKTLSSLLCSLGLAAAAAFLPLTAHAQDAQPGNPAAAASKVAMCIGCHGIPGYRSSFPEIHKVPLISGQNAKYIETALLAYRKGDRKHPTMRGIAASLSDQDIADSSAYYERSGASVQPVKGRSVEPSAEVAALLNKGNCASCHGNDLNTPIDGSYPKLAGDRKSVVEGT